jgi:hypothetical protein
VNTDTETDTTTTKREIPIFEVWEKYEGIAMHFNDLLIRLRMQALGGVAAITTIVAVVGHQDPGTGFNWAIATAVFFFLNLFWIAIWILDFRYYNRLLHGAVDALISIENKSKTSSFIDVLTFSTDVEAAVTGKSTRSNTTGRTWFYGIISAGLLLGFVVSTYHFFCK